MIVSSDTGYTIATLIVVKTITNNEYIKRGQRKITKPRFSLLFIKNVYEAF